MNLAAVVDAAKTRQADSARISHEWLYWCSVHAKRYHRIHCRVRGRWSSSAVTDVRTVNRVEAWHKEYWLV